MPGTGDAVLPAGQDPMDDYDLPMSDSPIEAPAAPTSSSGSPPSVAVTCLDLGQVMSNASAM